MCTSFRVTATDGAVVVGRTMEFPNAMATKLTVLPRAYRGTGIGKHGSGMKWTSAYGVVGMDAFGQPGTMTDAMNERGLYAGLLYMPGFCEYTSAEDRDPAGLMSIIDTVAYVLGVSATVEEATAAMSRATVWPYMFGPFGFAPPAHLVLHDASGKCAVIEWRNGEMTVFDNPIGVACNWPHLDWHLTNLRNYINLSDRNPAAITIDGVELGAMGQGPGMNGLPGDSSSPSRFVLSRPGGRPAWPGHRRPTVGEARSGSRPALLHSSAACRHVPHRSHDRPRPCLPAGQTRTAIMPQLPHGHQSQIKAHAPSF
jgi:choloylglycine hydrolase